MTTIHEQFDQIATSAPERIALVQGDREVSYAALKDRADALAWRLRAAGAGRETPVGVYLHRSCELVVALLATLKAGATYVPLSPDHPAGRLRHIAAASGAALIVTTGELADEARRLGPPVLVPDASAPPGPVEGVRVHPDSLAYLIYTSGSTGEPKGVGVTHRNLLGLVRDQDYVRFAPDETFLQLAPSSFDASAFEIWGALLNGARLVIAAPSYQAIDELPAVLRRQAVTTLLLTPPLFHELARDRLPAFALVRRLIVGGDAMSPTLARRYARDAAARGATLANVYGPTEATTLVSCHDVGQDAESIPIGKPIDNAALYLLDANLRPVPAGATGEIHIGGTCVTRGYVGDPGLTARRFLPDPFSTTPGARMYATGDVGRQGEDGEIEFVGRNDDQIKIRAHRVEPREVEHALLGHAMVRAAAVTATEAEAGTRQLVAHVVVDVVVEDFAAVLREFLRVRLPPYLIPSSFHRIDALPLTRAGKVDREKLRSLTPQNRDGTRETAMSPRQSIVADVWQRILGVDNVGLDDDFFALGGDSILAIRAITEAEAAGVELELSELFFNPTIRGAVPPTSDAAAPHPAEPPLLPAADLAALPDHVERAYPATAMQLGLIFEAMYGEDESLYHDVVTRRVTGPFDAGALREALDLVTARHAALRTSFDLIHFSVPVQLVDRTPQVPLTVVDSRADLEAARPFDYRRGPLLRVIVTLGDDAGFHITYGFRHAIMDGWSEAVFTAELFTAYDALLAGKRPDLPELGSDYEAFVRLEQAALASEETRRFWRERCPTSSTPSPPMSAARIKLGETLPDAVVSGLESVSASCRLPFKTLLVAAHLAALPGSSPTTGLVVNGRPESADGDRLVGLFLNVVPLSAKVGGSWEELAQRVFEAERAMLPHRRFPYPAIREMVSAPPFEVIFNYVHFHLDSAPVRPGGVQVGEPDIKDKTNYPLLVELVREPRTGGLRLELTADPGRWSEPALRGVLAAHTNALRNLAGDPYAEISVQDGPDV